jgi:DNA mismatch endonuclease (patch repair protein)
MVDIVSSETRSRMMSGIRGKNTKPEILIRKVLFAQGFRYRIHDKNLPGKPDLVLPKYKAVIFIQGCFWHLHDCHLFKWPKSREDFWREKIESNKARDVKVIRDITASGWRILIIWECALKGKTRRSLEELSDMVVDWIRSDTPYLEVAGCELTDSRTTKTDNDKRRCTETVCQTSSGE